MYIYCIHLFCTLKVCLWVFLQLHIFYVLRVDWWFHHFFLLIIKLFLWIDFFFLFLFQTQNFDLIKYDDLPQKIIYSLCENDLCNVLLKLLYPTITTIHYCTISIKPIVNYKQKSYCTQLSWRQQCQWRECIWWNLKREVWRKKLKRMLLLSVVSN